MTDEIKVRVVEFGDRHTYQLQWTDPNTGRKKTKSSEVERTGKKSAYDEAVKAAGEWQRKLNDGEVVNHAKLTWAQFRERYEREVTSKHADSTQRKNDTTFDYVESMINPKRLTDLTAVAISAWLHELQKTRSPATAGIYGRTLKAALNWAEEMKLIRECPKFRVPKKQGDMAAGRAFCGEECDRIKAAVAKVMPATHVAEWERLLDGLYWSGFRLGELLALSWDASADVVAIVIEGERPVVRFKAKGQKARRDEIWPCPPEFAEMLEATPEGQRAGFVFAAPMRRKGKGRARIQYATNAISTFGEKAGVVTGESPDETATAHDYRRTFGTRWAKRVMPAVLKRLMRHSCIQTTMAYYVTADAAEIADELWQKFGNGNTLSNTAPAEVVNS